MPWTADTETPSDTRLVLHRAVPGTTAVPGRPGSAREQCLESSRYSACRPAWHREAGRRGWCAGAFRLVAPTAWPGPRAQSCHAKCFRLPQNPPHLFARIHKRAQADMGDGSRPLGRHVSNHVRHHPQRKIVRLHLVLPHQPAPPARQAAGRRRQASRAVARQEQRLGREAERSNITPHCPARGQEAARKGMVRLTSERGSDVPPAEQAKHVSASASAPPHLRKPGAVPVHP